MCDTANNLVRNNLVKWYEWNDDTLCIAKEEEKPIFLSIGYS